MIFTELGKKKKHCFCVWAKQYKQGRFGLGWSNDNGSSEEAIEEKINSGGKKVTAWKSGRGGRGVAAVGGGGEGGGGPGRRRTASAVAGVGGGDLLGPRWRRRPDDVARSLSLSRSVSAKFRQTKTAFPNVTTTVLTGPGPDTQTAGCYGNQQQTGGETVRHPIRSWFSNAWLFRWPTSADIDLVNYNQLSALSP